jgi:hypothetical protein
LVGSNTCSNLPATAAALADALVDVRDREAQIGAEKQALVAQWALVHTGDGVESSALPGTERAVSCGGKGTPKVGEFAAVELGALLGMTTHGARALMADVLDLQHRHPSLWTAVLAGRVPGWKASHVARRCRAVELTRAQARFVDASTTDAITALPWTRFLPLLEARIIEADPESAEARRLEAATRRYFGTTRADEHGLKTLYARHDSGDITLFAAVADRGHWFEVDQSGTRHLGKAEPPAGLELVLSRLLLSHAAS